MIYIFTGPAPLAQLVREELLSRGVGADLHSRGLLVGLYGPALAGSAGLQSVVVTEETAERHSAVIEEVLALVSPVNPSEVTPAKAPLARGDEISAVGAQAARAADDEDGLSASPARAPRPSWLRLPWSRRGHRSE
jgi:hypothetical protein